MAWRLSPRTVSGSRVEENQESLLLRCPPRWNFVALGGKTIGQAIFFRHGCHFYGIRTLFHKDVQGGFGYPIPYVLGMELGIFVVEKVVEIGTGLMEQD
jgi:hypothetical protein